MNKIKLIFIVCSFLLVTGCVQNEKIESNLVNDTLSNEDYEKLEQLAQDISEDIKEKQYMSEIDTQKINDLLEKEKNK